jgi:hypothetical protein
LATGLGVADREQKVARYYHEMEQGRLEPRGVSDRVLVLLAELLGTSCERLREGGAALRVGGEPAAGVTFARAARPAEGQVETMMEAPASPAPADQPDEVDRLFTGGSEA